MRLIALILISILPGVAYVNSNTVSFCLKPTQDVVTHDSCLDAIQNGERLYQSCNRDDGCSEFQSGDGVRVGLATRTDNSVRYLYDEKWYFIRNIRNQDKDRSEIQCWVYDMTPCAD